MSTNAEILAQWLRDAHAMEQQAKSMLTAQSSRVENYPELKHQLETHLAETERQAERLSTLLETRGGRSMLKDTGGKLMAGLQGIAGAMTADEAVKAGIANFAFENFEIASYRSLIAAAEACGDEEVKRTAEDILKEEEATASWFEDNMPGIIHAYMEREARGETLDAKR